MVVVSVQGVLCCGYCTEYSGAVGRSCRTMTIRIEIENTKFMAIYAWIQMSSETCTKEWRRIQDVGREDPSLDLNELRAMVKSVL